MGKRTRRLTGPKRRKKPRLAAPVVEIPPFEFPGYDVPTDLTKVSRLLQVATPEVQDNILCECKIIYECKTCREMFRDPNEFISHKIDVCKERQLVTSPGPLTRSRARSVKPSTSKNVPIETIDLGDSE